MSTPPDFPGPHREPKRKSDKYPSTPLEAAIGSSVRPRRDDADPSSDYMPQRKQRKSKGKKKRRAQVAAKAKEQIAGVASAPPYRKAYIVFGEPDKIGKRAVHYIPNPEPPPALAERQAQWRAFKSAGATKRAAVGQAVGAKPFGKKIKGRKLITNYNDYERGLQKVAHANYMRAQRDSMSD